MICACLKPFDRSSCSNTRQDLSRACRHCGTGHNGHDARDGQQFLLVRFGATPPQSGCKTHFDEIAKPLSGLLRLIPAHEVPDVLAGIAVIACVRASGSRGGACCINNRREGEDKVSRIYRTSPETAIRRQGANAPCTPKRS
jgi:hypothetical protein